MLPAARWFMVYGSIDSVSLIVSSDYMFSSATSNFALLCLQGSPVCWATSDSASVDRHTACPALLYPPHSTPVPLLLLRPLRPRLKSTKLLPSSAETLLWSINCLPSWSSLLYAFGFYQFPCSLTRYEWSCNDSWQTGIYEYINLQIVGSPWCTTMCQSKSTVYWYTAYISSAHY